MEQYPANINVFWSQPSFRLSTCPRGPDGGRCVMLRWLITELIKLTSLDCHMQHVWNCFILFHFIPSSSIRRVVSIPRLEWFFSHSSSPPNNTRHRRRAITTPGSLPACVDLYSLILFSVAFPISLKAPLFDDVVHTIHRPSSYEGPSFCCAERSRARSVAYGAFICPCPFWSIANTQQIPGRVRTGAKRRLETTNSIRHPTILSHRVGRYRFHL